MIDTQKDYIIDNIIAEQMEIERVFSAEIRKWEKPAKLIILGEAPLESKKYFYKIQGNFLNSIKLFYKVEQNQLLESLRNNVLILDIFQFPISTHFYEKDTFDILFDGKYFEAKLTSIKKIVDDETKFVFRYKKLIRFSSRDELKSLNYIDNDINKCYLNEKERSVQELSKLVFDYLKSREGKQI